MRLIRKVDVITSLDGAVANKVAGDQLKNLHLHDKIGSQEVEAIKAMIANDACLASKELLRPVPRDEVDSTSVGQYEQMLTRRQVEVCWRC